MADSEPFKDVADFGVDDETESLDIGLFEKGDGGFHTKNDPNNLFQRSNVIQRTGAVDIRCNVIDVIHGKMAPDSDETATLIVLLFRFDPRKKARRISEAQIELTFSGMTADDPRPVVEAISLDGRFNLAPSKQSESITKGADGKVGLSAIQGAEISGGLKWEKTVTRDTQDFTTVTGSIDLIGFNFGDANVARWTLTENETLKTGVPAAVRTGILLRRSGNENFKAVVEMEIKADLQSSLGSLFKSKPADDPVIFNPSKKPTNKLLQYDANDLGSFDLEKITDVTFMSIRDGAIKNL